MQISRVMLVKPAYKDSYYAMDDMPAGLGYISHALDMNSIENSVFDMCMDGGIKGLYQAIEKKDPQLIGLSLMSYRFLDHYALMDNIKERFPHILIVVGGPHLSLYREDVLRRCSAVDFGVVLEGDETIVELCNNIDNLSEVKGLIYRVSSPNDVGIADTGDRLAFIQDLEKDRPGKVTKVKEMRFYSGDNADGSGIVYTGDRPYIKDLIGIGWPKYAGFDLTKYTYLTIVTSRGCPYKCTFCSVLYTIGTDWRFRPAADVVDEMEYWYHNGMRKFEIGDDNFTLVQERVYEICDLIEERGLVGLDLGLGNGIRADRVDKPLLQRMKDVGFSYIAFGVEGGNDKTLTQLRKGEKMSDIEAGIKASCEVGLPVQLFFLLGAPGETEEDVKDSVEFCLKYPVIDCRFYNILPFPQSELYNDLIAQNENARGARFLRDPETHLNDSSAWFFLPVFETPELPEADRIRLLKWANKTTRKHTDEVNRKRNLEKYCLIGWPYAFAWVFSKLRTNKPLKDFLNKIGVAQFLKGVLQEDAYHKQSISSLATDKAISALSDIPKRALSPSDILIASKGPVSEEEMREIREDSMPKPKHPWSRKDKAWMSGKPRPMKDDRVKAGSVKYEAGNLSATNKPEEKVAK
jgi:anaerobic magnesium-protoporphyrin IX monomethyl ester cyclase